MGKIVLDKSREKRMVIKIINDERSFMKQKGMLEKEKVNKLRKIIEDESVSSKHI